MTVKMDALRDQRSFWGSVVAGDVILDQEDKSWKVEAIDDTRVLIVDRRGNRGTIARPPADREVVKMVKPLDLIKFDLGGDLIAMRGTTDQIWHAPMMADHSLSLARTHMLDLHHVDCSDVATLERIIELHAKAEPAVPHDHTKRLKP